MTRTTDFDAVTVDTLRALGGMKWARFPDAIGAFVAEMDFGCAPPIQQALHAAVDRAPFGYLPPGLARDMAEACADFTAWRYGWRLPPERVHPLGDVIAGLQAAIEHYSRPGSPVVLPTPAYMPFLKVPRMLGRELIQVPLVPDRGRLVYDLDGLDRAFAEGGGLLVHCNPYNPVGRVFTTQEQAALAEVVERHGVRVFSDEIHAPLVHPGHRHVPYASISHVTAGHALTSTSASKAWNLPGLKCAQMIISNDEDAAKWERVGEMAGHGASNLGVVANTAAYADGGPWLDTVLTYLDGNRHLLGDLLSENLPAVRWTMPEGTYLAWLDCRPLDLGDHPGGFFREHAGVVLVDGPACGAPGRGFVRLNFATPRSVLTEMVRRMGAAVRGHR